MPHDKPHWNCTAAMHLAPQQPRLGCPAAKWSYYYKIIILITHFTLDVSLHKAVEEDRSLTPERTIKVRELETRIIADCSVLLKTGV